jgi:hypothetical protein
MNNLLAGATLPWRLNFTRERLIFSGSENEPCFMPHLGRLRIWGFPSVFGNFVQLCRNEAFGFVKFRELPD